MENQFFICNRCGNIALILHNGKADVNCCGEKMKKIIPGTTDGDKEKHIPVYDVNNGTVTVTVGASEHPMTSEHYIEWIFLESEDGFKYKQLKPNMSPVVSFSISENDKIKAVYAFCGKHGLWKA